MRFPWGRGSAERRGGRSGGGARFGLGTQPDAGVRVRTVAFGEVALPLTDLDGERFRAACAAGAPGAGAAGMTLVGARAFACDALADALAVPESAALVMAPAAFGRRARTQMSPATRGRLFAADLGWEDAASASDAVRRRVVEAAEEALARCASVARAAEGTSAGAGGMAAGATIAADAPALPRVLFVFGTRAALAPASALGADAGTDAPAAPETVLRAACDELAAAHPAVAFLPILLDGPADPALLYPVLLAAAGELASPDAPGSAGSSGAPGVPEPSTGPVPDPLASPLDPRSQVQLAVCSLLVADMPPQADRYSANLVGAGVPLDPTCELYGFLACTTYMRVRQVPASVSLDGLRGMRTAAKNILIDPHGLAACTWMERALGIPFHQVRPSLIAHRMGREYASLARFLGVEFDSGEVSAAAMADLAHERSWLEDVRVVVGPSAAGNPFEVASLLANLGAQVALIVADDLTERDVLLVEGLRASGTAEDVLVMPLACAAVVDTAAVAKRLGAVDVAIGLDAGLLVPEAPVVLPEDGYRTLGYRAPLCLLRDVRAALDAPRTAPELLGEGLRRRTHDLEEFRRAAGATMNGALARAAEKKAEAQAAAEREREIR